MPASQGMSLEMESIYQELSLLTQYILATHCTKIPSLRRILTLSLQLENGAIPVLHFKVKLLIVIRHTNKRLLNPCW